MKVQNVHVSKITEGERFRKDLGDLATLIASITEKGIEVPLIVSQDFTLLAGGRRLAAAKQIGLRDIPCVIRKTNDELDLREVELLENVMRKDMTWTERAMLEKRIWDLRTAKDPKWTMEKQGNELDTSKSQVHRRLTLAKALEEIPELAEAKSEDEAWKMLKGMEEQVVREVALEKAKADPKNQVKKVRLALDNYIIGNALEQIRNVNSGAIHFCEVDPPYGIDYDTYQGNRGGVGQKARAAAYTETDDYVALITTIAQQCFRILSGHGLAIFWHASKRHQDTLTAIQSAGFEVNLVPAIWVRGGGGRVDQPDVSLAPSYEPFFVCRKGMPKLAKPGRANVFSFQGVQGEKRIHPTEKPVELMVEILETFTLPGAIVCSPFLGSGVTLRAAYRTNRKAFGWDLDESFKARFVAQVKEEQDAGVYGE